MSEQAKIDPMTGEPVPKGPLPGEDKLDGLKARVAFLEALAAHMAAQLAIHGVLNPDHIDMLWRATPIGDFRANTNIGRHAAGRWYRRVRGLIGLHHAAQLANLTPKRAAPAASPRRRAA